MHVVQQLDRRGRDPCAAARTALARSRDTSAWTTPSRAAARSRRARTQFLRLRDAVRLLDAGHAALRADRLVSLRDVFADLGAALVDVLAVRMAVDEHAFARAPAEQLVQRRLAHLAEDVPQRDVDRGDRRHRHRAAAPVRAAIEELPDVLDAPRVAADQIRHQVVLEVRGDREFAAVQCCVADTGNTRARDDFQRDEVARRAGDDDFRGDDLAIRCAEPAFAIPAFELFAPIVLTPIAPSKDKN